MGACRRAIASSSSIAALMLAVHGWSAQNPSTEADTGRLLEVVVTTATKKSEAEAAQDVPVAMSVLGGEELSVRRVTDLEDLSYAMPNVALDGIGTGKGIANFSIRGIGVAGSIPSIDPTVGVFVDGVYLGVSYGVIMDMMDLEAVEV
ncbi:MAG: Plug domain-containing protein, partial [Gammaproteobacteria bacterium]|nr:Plug domain-containing protein [Gammaproteobacteria bacterium]